MSHSGSLHLYSTLTVMLYSAGECIRACIITSPDTGLEVLLFEGCASMLIGGGAIYTEYTIKIMYQVPSLGAPSASNAEHFHSICHIKVDQYKIDTSEWLLLSL